MLTTEVDVIRRGKRIRVWEAVEMAGLHVVPWGDHMHLPDRRIRITVRNRRRIVSRRWATRYGSIVATGGLR